MRTKHSTQLWIISIALIALLALSAATSYAAYESSLVGYWKFDDGSGTLADDSARSNDGTLHGNSLPVWSSGKFGSALTFSNAGRNYVEVPYGSGDLKLGNSGTVAFWAKTSNFGSGSRMYYMYGNGNGADAFSTVFTNSSTLGTRWNGGNNWLYATVPTANAWHFFVFRDDNGSLSLSIDNVQVATGTGGVAAQNNYKTIIGGSINYSYWNSTDSTIDDFAIWNVYKTNAQIYDIYVNGIHPADFASLKTELSGYIASASLSSLFTDTELNTLTTDVLNGTSGSLGGGLYHYEPIEELVGSDYYYKFDNLSTKPQAFSWSWGTGSLSAYDSLNDWYNTVVTGTLITADGNSTITGNEVWFLKTGGGVEGGGAPEPATVVGMALAAIVAALRRRFRLTIS